VRTQRDNPIPRLGSKKSFAAIGMNVRNADEADLQDTSSLSAQMVAVESSKARLKWASYYTTCLINKNV
jgi:hypothetical protein